MASDITGARLYRDIQKQDPDIKTVELVCLHDGTVIEELDDGPHPVMGGKALPGWEKLAPNPGRQRILRLMRKRDGLGNPLWLATKPGVRIWDPAFMQFIECPVMGPHLDEAKKAHAAKFAERAAEGRMLAEARKEKAAEAKKDDEAAVLGVLSKLLGKAEAPAKTPAKKDGAA